jgi:hypothetical protein
MKRSVLILGLLALVSGLLVIGAGVLNSGAVRNAGVPRDLAELEGRWVLDHLRGSFDVAPPGELVFSAGTIPGRVRISDGGRAGEFEIQGAGLLVFDSAPHLEPLMPDGSKSVYTMTHLCPPLPAWDHLMFFPDGQPIGHDPNRRSITYERE